MTSHVTGIAKRSTTIFSLIASALTFGPLAPVTLAQGPIRVETNQVLVPVIVVDSERLHRVRRSLEAAHIESSAIPLDFTVHDLVSADFQLLDDGKAQPIQSVTKEPFLSWAVVDNEGMHTEYIGPGGGKWSTKWPRLRPPGEGIGDSVWHIEFPEYYLIAYNLPKSPEGSCHQIRAKVDRASVLVAARSEYCNTVHPASDPITGTKLDEQLQTVLASAKDPGVDISLTAIVLRAASGASWVHFALDWPGNSLKAELNKAVLAMVLSKNGSLLTRISDLAERGGISDRSLRDRPDWVRQYGHRYKLEVESRYETQLILPPGDYNLRVALGDGKRFGRAEIPLVVEAFDGKRLTMSTLSLCKPKQIVYVASYGDTAWTAKPPLSYVPLVSKGSEYKPTGNTRFKKNETVYTYFEVYEPLLAEQSPSEVKMQVRIVDAATGKIKTDSPPVSAMQYVKAGSTTIPIGLGVGTSMLTKGSYRLEVQVTDSAGQTTPWRTATFTIE